MTNKVAFLALLPVLAAAAAGCAAGSANPTVGGVGSTSSGASGSSPAGTFQAAHPSGGTARPSGSGHATDGTDDIRLSPRSTTSVVAWYHGKGGAAFTVLTKVVGQAEQAKASGVTAFGKKCGAIESAAKAAQAAPPFPVANAAKWYTSALKGYVKSAADCQRDISSQNQALLEQAERDVAANDSNLNRAAAVLIVALSSST